jgi:RNA polymerase sigma-54 factor
MTTVTMELNQYEDLLVQQAPTVSFQLVASSQILELTSAELEQRVADELAANPALERVETPTCQACGDELRGSICPTCLARQRGDATTRELAWDAGSQPEQLGTAADEDDFDVFQTIAAGETLAERLQAQLSLLLPGSEQPIAEYLVGSLNDKGYLTVTVEEAADDLAVESARVRAVLRALQQLEPAGIGASSVRECLLIQIDALAAQGLDQPYAREIIGDYLFELGRRKFASIAAELPISEEAVEAVWHFMRSELNPHPTQGLAGVEQETRHLQVSPDVVIRRGPAGFEVEVVESRRVQLRVNALYGELYQAQRRGEAGLSSAESEHVKGQVQRARFFIARIEQRFRTLQRITSCIVERQRDYLERGVRQLKPLNRVEIALSLDLHESTVSRATNGKYALLPSGEVIPYSTFFTPSLSIKDVMREIIKAAETPLSDREIGQLLAERGIEIARRTVAKYRMALGLAAGKPNLGRTSDGARKVLQVG